MAGMTQRDSYAARCFSVTVLGHAGDMPVVVNNRCLGFYSAEKTVEVPQLPFFAGSLSMSLSWSRGRFPWSSCSEDHGNSAVAVFLLGLMPLLCRSCSMPGVCVRQWVHAASVVWGRARRRQRQWPFVVVLLIDGDTVVFGCNSGFWTAPSLSPVRKPCASGPCWAFSTTGYSMVSGYRNQHFVAFLRAAARGF